MSITEYKDMINQQLAEAVAQDQQVQETKKPVLGICFTGKRAKNLAGYNRQSYQQLFDKLYEFLYRLVEVYKAFDIVFYSGGAQGFDQLAFWAVEKVKKSYPVKNVVVVPFKGQENPWKEQGTFSRADYNLMLNKADKVVVLSEDNTNYADKYTARNHYMVDKSDAVIGLFNEISGGTGECIHYALKQRKDRAMTIYQIPYEITNGTVVPQPIRDYSE